MSCEQSTNKERKSKEQSKEQSKVKSDVVLRIAHPISDPSTNPASSNLSTPNLLCDLPLFYKKKPMKCCNLKLCLRKEFASQR